MCFLKQPFLLVFGKFYTCSLLLEGQAKIHLILRWKERKHRSLILRRLQSLCERLRLLRQVSCEAPGKHSGTWFMNLILPTVLVMDRIRFPHQVLCHFLLRGTGSRLLQPLVKKSSSPDPHALIPALLCEQSLLLTRSMLTGKAKTFPALHILLKSMNFTVDISKF